MPYEDAYIIRPRWKGSDCSSTRIGRATCSYSKWSFFFSFFSNNHRALQTRSSGDIDPVDAIGGDDTMRLSFCLGARVGAVANELSNLCIQLILGSQKPMLWGTENESMHVFSPLLPLGHGNDLIMSDLTIRSTSVDRTKAGLRAGQCVERKRRKSRHPTFVSSRLGMRCTTRSLLS